MRLFFLLMSAFENDFQSRWEAHCDLLKRAVLAPPIIEPIKKALFLRS